MLSDAVSAANKKLAAQHNYLSVRQTAELLNTHPNTIRGWIATGKLRAYRYGDRLVRINPADLDAMREPYSPIDWQVWA